MHAMKAGICSFRLGGRDGVSAAVAGLAGALALLDIDTVTIAGEGRADRIVPGLSASWGEAPDRARRKRYSQTWTLSWSKTCSPFHCTCPHRWP
jgi:hypothetical protein